MKAVVWSRNQCSYCVQAKMLLKNKGYDVEERNIEGSKWTKADLFEALPNARTVPQIFIDGLYIGGFTELSKKLGQE